MDTGSVSFHNSKLRRYMKNVEKDREMIKAIMKTKREEHPNLQKLKQKRLMEIQK